MHTTLYMYDRNVLLLRPWMRMMQPHTHVRVIPVHCTAHLLTIGAEVDCCLSFSVPRAFRKARRLALLLLRVLKQQLSLSLSDVVAAAAVLEMFEVRQQQGEWRRSERVVGCVHVDLVAITTQQLCRTLYYNIHIYVYVCSLALCARKHASCAVVVVSLAAAASTNARTLLVMHWEVF